MISPIENGSGSREAQPVKKPTKFATDFIAATTNDASNLAAQYIEHGWRLVPIPNGSKGPKTMGWNRKENTIADSTAIPPGYGVGLAHAYSKTMALDIDNWQHAAALLAQRGVDLRTLYDAPDAVTIESGREGRGKLIYAMPFGLTLPTKRINYAAADDDTKVAYELRCATADGLTAQDVLPSTAIHPITQQPYRWGGKGHWSRLPTLPLELLSIWQELTTLDTSRAVQTNQPTACSATKPVVTLEIAREMLTFISADCGYDDWRNVGMGLAHQFGGAAFDLWNDWSKTCPSRYKEREMQGLWRSFKTDKAGGIAIGTVMHMARQGGWAGLSIDAQGLFRAIDFSPLAKTTIDSATGEIMPATTPSSQPQIVSITDLDSFAPAAPSHWVDELLPADVVTLLGAHGGTGKTTLAVHAAVCFAMGLPFLGKETKRAKVLFYSAEDDAPMMRWKLYNECQRLGVDPVQLSHWLTVIDASEADAVLYVEARRDGVTKGQPTAAFQDLVNTIAQQGSQIVIMDNASDLYGGNENDRGQVRGFIRLLAQLVKPMHGAVLLLAHVDKLTARNGGTQGYSGSTAWHNSVRSRLFLSADDKTGDLVLEHQKANRGKKADPIRLVFEGPMLTLAQAASGPDALQTLGDIAPILSLLEEFFQRGEFISTSPTAHTNAYKMLSNESAYPKRISKADLWQLIRSAERGKHIYRESYQTAQRKPAERWRVSAPSLADMKAQT